MKVRGHQKTSPLSEIEWVERQIAHHERELKNYQEMLRRVRGRDHVPIPANMEKFFKEPEG